MLVSVRRRSLLASAGAALSPPLAGCLEQSLRPSSGDTSKIDCEHGAEPLNQDETMPPNTYPDYPDEVVRTIGYDEIDPDEADAVLEPSERTVEVGESIAFTLENRGEKTLETNFFSWYVHKWVDGEWFSVAPRLIPQPLATLEPGESHTWDVTVRNADIEDGAPVPLIQETEELDVSGMGGGHYAFGTQGSFETDSIEEKTAFAATFELEADPLRLTPTNAVDEIRREGDTLVATTDRGDPDHELHRLGAYEVDRVDDPPADPKRVITEQVVRNDQLRDALALVRDCGADRVRLEEYNDIRPIFGSREEGVYEYRGSYYEVTTRELETS